MQRALQAILGDHSGSSSQINLRNQGVHSGLRGTGQYASRETRESGQTERGMGEWPGERVNC